MALILLHALPDDFKLLAQGDNFTLTALPDDWKLHSDGDVERTNRLLVYFELLTDTTGEVLTDPSGEPLGIFVPATYNLQVLHALQDDFKLHAESL